MSSTIKKQKFNISGMHCANCEARIEKILSGLRGVKQVKASFARNTATVVWDDGETTIAAMGAALAADGYALDGGGAAPGVDTASTAGKKLKINQLIGIGIVVFAVYFVISKTVGFNFFPEVTQSMGYGMLFLVGLLTSLHCVAMCGGINMSQCIARGDAAAGTPAKGKLMPSLMYNAGRVISYTVIGGIVGALGSVISFSGWARGVVAIASGLFMVVMGLSMLGTFPWINRLVPKMPRFLKRKADGAKRGRGPLVVGLLNGMMPCGPLQAMQLYALGTGSAAAGALSMLLFSLGTVPLMFGLGALSSLLSSKFTSRMLKVSAALVLLLGLVMVNRGFALSGVVVAAPQVKSDQQGQGTGALAGVTVKDGVQQVTSTLKPGSYPNITVQKGIPVRWTIQADAKNINGCNRTLVIPKFDKQVSLKPGDNIIEFMPDASGTIPYSCWMGMIQAKITVVDDVSKAGGGSGGNNTGSGAVSNNATGGTPAGGTPAGGCCASAALAPAFAGGKIPVDKVAIAKMVNGVQEVTINVDDSGYSPAVTVVQKGVKTKIRFASNKLNQCNDVVVFPDFNGSLNLSRGQLETPALTPEQDFTFQCGMGMLHGYVKVVADINKVNIDDVKKEVSGWTPPVGSTGCCGG